MATLKNDSLEFMLLQTGDVFTTILTAIDDSLNEEPTDILFEIENSEFEFEKYNADDGKIKFSFTNNVDAKVVVTIESMMGGVMFMFHYDSGNIVTFSDMISFMNTLKMNLNHYNV